MSDNNQRFDRRTVLKGLGTIGLVGAGGAALTGGGAAATSGLSVSNSSVSNDNGDLSQVQVDITHEAAWDGFDIPVHAVAYKDTMTVSDGSGNTLISGHELNNDLQTPVLLSNISAQGSTDGWGGTDEYVTVNVDDEDDTATDAAGNDVVGALNATVHAGIVWNVLTENGGNSLSVENPASITDAGLDVAGDTDTDVSKTYTVTLEKTVQFYTIDSNGSYTAVDGSTTLRKLGADDGTVASTVASGSFDVTVTNEHNTQSSSSTSGDSTAS